MCYKQFDASYIGPAQKNASSAMTSYSVDTNWYVDSGATDHVTSELEKLTICDKYGGHDQLHSASEVGMEINHIGSSILCTPTSNIHLNKILHVPHASKSLLSIHHLAHDNHAFLEFHPIIFLLRNRGRGRPSLEVDVKEGFTP
jgi:histone deacetylase 1/2